MGGTKSLYYVESRMPRFAIAMTMALLLMAMLAACGTSSGDTSLVGGLAETKDKPITEALIKTLREISPETEGPVWMYTDGNRLTEDWILDLPGCWGDPSCGTKEGDPLPRGVQNLLDVIEDKISNAERTVSVSCQTPFPTYAIRDMIINGIKKAYDKGHTPVIRLIVGAYAFADKYNPELAGAKQAMSEWLTQLGPDYRDRVKMVMANTMTATIPTMFATLSWNHSKIIAIDSETVIMGGANWWGHDYAPIGYTGWSTTHNPDGTTPVKEHPGTDPFGRTNTPMNDINMYASGPVAAQAVEFLDLLWDWICINREKKMQEDPKPPLCLPVNPNKNFKYYTEIAFSPAADNQCPGGFAVGHPVPKPTGEGHGILALGRLGLGIEVGEDHRAKIAQISIKRTNPYESDFPSPPWPKPDFYRNGSCFYNPWDFFNAGQDPNYTYYDKWNPTVPAVIEFLKQAKESIFISQLGIFFDKCKKRFPLPWYDGRAMNVLADKMLDGVDVTLVESSLGAQVPGGGTYSMQDSIFWTITAVSQKMLERAKLRGLDETAARNAYCNHFYYAPLRYATWPDGSVVEEFPNAELYIPPPPPWKVWKPRWKKARSVQPGNHAKFWAVDRKAFVIGSHNAIPWNLQEYSFMIEEPELVEEMYEKYIDILWHYSRMSAYQDPSAANPPQCTWRLTMPDPDPVDSISSQLPLPFGDAIDAQGYGLPATPDQFVLPSFGDVADDPPCMSRPEG